MADFASFDDAVAAGNATQGIDTERPNQNITPLTTPNPANLISDHSAEGAPYLPAARDIPQDPPAPPQWKPNHKDHIRDYGHATNAQSGEVVGNPHALGAHQSDNHDGTEGGTNPTVWGPNYSQPNAYGLLNIGAPFLAVQNRFRHLRQNVFDSRGFNVNPQDAPSAPVQQWNSIHNTAPRWIGFDVSPLFENVGKGPQFSTNPGYLGVSDNQPNRTPRQHGSEAAQQPDDPYVYQGPSSGPSEVDYGWDF
jgi:hypothetical protein